MIKLRKRGNLMNKHRPEYEIAAAQRGTARCGSRALGIYRPGFRFKSESLAFFRLCVGEETYARAMQSEAGKHHHFVVARAFLNQANWEKFVWIEEYGSLDGFPG